jgi:AcrR family transcriptional regulator
MLTDRQQQILDESVKLIDRNGIQGFTIKNLSKEVGISEPAIYRHFESKFGILCSILDTFKAQILTNQEEFIRNLDDPFVKLRMFYNRIFEIFTKNPALITVIFSEEIFQNEKLLSEKIQEIQRINEMILITFLTEMRRNNKLPHHVNIDSFILMFFGSIRLLAKKWKLSGYAFNLREKGDELFNSLIQTLS